MTSKRTLVIAEAGVNHNGDLDLAKELIDVAARAGADLVKFQTFTASRLATPLAKKAKYQTQNSIADEKQLEMLRQLELSNANHDELVAHCRSKGIGFFSTGFDIESVRFLLGLGLQSLKIPSGEITNLPYLRFIGSQGLPIIMSTGMCDMRDIAAALDILEIAGTDRSLITILHCTTNYPTLMEEVNLKAMLSIAEEFGVNVGYSDHTLGIEVPIAAVALGASVIEKHFTLSRDMNGPDHKASLEPVELRSMIKAIRNIEEALGDGVKQPVASEENNLAVARKSLVASEAICTGETFSTQNVVAKRPGTGISPMRWDEVMGKTARRNYEKDELIEL